MRWRCCYVPARQISNSMASCRLGASRCGGADAASTTAKSSSLQRPLRSAARLPIARPLCFIFQQLLLMQMLHCTDGMRLLLIRHAQSQNNVVAREVRLRAAREGASLQDAKQNFESKRVEDPDLSALGMRQSDVLAKFLQTDKLLGLDNLSAQPVRLYCSPMRRTLLTARPLLCAFPSWVAGIDERLFEVGGLFTRSADGSDVSTRGCTASELETEFGEDFSLSATLRANIDQGWYTLGSRETREEAQARAQTLCKWLHAMEDAGDTSMVVLCIHGDLLSMLLRELLGTTARFLHYNTACTCLELRSSQCTLLFQNRAQHLTDEDRTGEEMLAVIS